MKNIVNIVNFVRGIEPRPGRDIDLHKPVIEQIRIMRENQLTGTFLLQYDALIDPEFHDIIETCRDFCEIGLWFEIVQPLVEAIGEEWRGRYPWDWFNDVGFLIGYELDVRLRLIDHAMEKFKEIYGKYPASVGSWHIDAVSMKYLVEKYHVTTCCIGGEGVGTDGYTMQGSYYNQAYYPSANNMFCPAQTEEQQIDLPVFRMLGSDPLFCYDCKLIAYEGVQTRCPTLEPASQLGNDPDYCDWFFKEVFNGNGISFQYTQTGQENSFGWPRMERGIVYQFPKIKQLADEGKLTVMTLEESGKWFRSQYKTTPPVSIATSSAWKNEQYKSIWYNSRYYRTNLIWNDGVVRLRDMYVFDERYEEHYLRKPCITNSCEFRNLPVMDGVLYSDVPNDVIAGIYFTAKGAPVHWDDLSYEEGDTHATVTLTGKAGKTEITFSETHVTVRSDVAGLCLSPVYSRDRVYGNFDSMHTEFKSKNNSKVNLTFITSAKVVDKTAEFCFDGFDYRVKVEKGRLEKDFCLQLENGELQVLLKQ